MTVTSLNLKLFGIRQDQASGQGSAIIAGSDGQQRSIAVGEEIEPGVTLKAVGFDSVTISRGGADEQLFMDQSQAPATVAAPTGPAAPAAPVAQPSTAVEPGGPPGTAVEALSERGQHGAADERHPADRSDGPPARQ